MEPKKAVYFTRQQLEMLREYFGRQVEVYDMRVARAELKRDQALSIGNAIADVYDQLA